MREMIYAHAIRNAAQYGRAEPKAVLAKVLGERPELRGRARELLKTVEEVVREVNALPRERVLGEAKVFAGGKAGRREKALPELPAAESREVRLRFAPNPSGPLHLGHARAAVLNHEYAERYGGRLVLRFEDTDPRRIEPEAYEMIKEDLRWLEVRWDEEVLQSRRLELYYEVARELVEAGKAYVCTCRQEVFKALREAGKPCGCRSTGSSVEEFERMFEEYGEGEAVLRLKTSLSHSNISLRDFPILRIVEQEHPIAGDRRVYPLMNFSVAVDDHDLRLSHILRGKDHILNTLKQGFIFSYLGWEKPVYLHYGLLKIEGLALSTSKIKEGIASGVYTGWDDLKLGTLSALRRRGIAARAVRKAMLEIGVKTTDISFSWRNLFAYNKELIDSVAKRYSFVDAPRVLKVKGCPALTARNRLHPTVELGFREVRLPGGDARFLISSSDHSSLKAGELIRLMGAYNIRVVRKDGDAEAVYESSELKDARERGARLINWVLDEDKVRVELHTPSGVRRGFGEKALLSSSAGEIVQFERVGFARIEEVSDRIVAVYAHQ